MGALREIGKVEDMEWELRCDLAGKVLRGKRHIA